ncbi:uncharacterized protein [Haliotis cracherodii]|uniref:uncharacterized protein n=1 Tax=Haliotis cracherodii TaxID=6455 RepID=UPI0039E8B05D
MSIWSRSHNDLAKLAKDLQERNNRVKANAARRGKGAARRQASSSDIAVLREKSLAYDTSHRRKPGDRTKSVRFVLSDEDCCDEITTEADLSDSGHCDTRHKYHKICVNKDLMNYEKRQANSLLSQKRINKESKSKFHGKELALFLEEQNDQNSLSLCNNTPSPTTEHGNSKESQSADNNVIRSDDADDASSGSNTQEKGVSRQILFLLQKDFINSSQDDSKQCLNMTDLEGLLSLLSVSRSKDAEDKHRNMIRMVETLILKRKSLHQKKGQAQDELDHTNDKNAKKDNIPQRGSNPSKIPRKNMRNMSPNVLAATKTDDAQKHDVVNRLSIEKHNGMDQEHCSVDGDVKGVPQNGNTTGSSKEEENVDGQHAGNVPDDIHTPNTVSRSRRGDELKEMSEDEHDETKEKSPGEELLHMKEHEQETDVKTSGVIVRCCDIIGESGSTSKESSGMAQGSGDDDVSVPGEYLVNSCIQPILPTDGDDGGLHVGCYSSGEEHGYDSQISGQEQITWGDCQRDSSGEESAHDSKISGQELELSQISGQEQMAGGDCQRDSSGEESAHDSKISGQELELSQISGQEQMAGGDCQRDSSGEESAHDYSISGQELELIEISGHEKELIDHQTDISGEDHTHEAQISRHKQKFIQISGHEHVARGNCQNVSSGDEHGYDLNAPGHQQEHQHDSWKLLHNVDVSEMSSFSISGSDSLCPLAGDLSEHVLKSPNVFSDTLMSNGTSHSKNDNSGANITTLPSVDGSVKASLANGVQHTETIANCGNKVDVEKNQTDHSKKRLISSETDMLTKDDTWLSSDSTQSSFSSRGNTKQYQIHADNTSQSPVAAGSKFMRAPFGKGSYEIKHNRKQGYYDHEDSSSSEKHLHRNCSDIESKALMNSRDCQEKIPRIKEKYCDGEVVTGDAESRGSQSDENYQCTCHRCVSFKRTEQQSAVLPRKKPCSPPGGIKRGKSTIDRKQHTEDDKPRRKRLPGTGTGTGAV